MNPRVAVVGLGLVAGPKPRNDVTLQDLIFEATYECLSQAKFPLEKVESVVLAASDLADGVGISSMITATAAGAYLKDEIKVAGDGMFGAILGYLRVVSGQYSSTLVVSWGKCSQGPMTLISSLMAEPFFYRPTALNEITTAGLQASGYLRQFGLDEEIGTLVAVKNLAIGLRNPRAHRQIPVTQDEVRRSRPLAWPLRELTVPPYSDGACALLMLSEAAARETSGPAAWVHGVGWAADPYELTEREPAMWGSLRRAATQAYGMAGIRDPLRELDVAEVSELTAFHELMAYEAMGLCKSGEGRRLFLDGVTAMGGRLPVSPSGGLLAANPHPASGLFRVAEAALQVTGRAGAHQVPEVRTALAHGTSGLGGQASGVMILGRG